MGSTLRTSHTYTYTIYLLKVNQPLSVDRDGTNFSQTIKVIIEVFDYVFDFKKRQL